LSGLPVLIVGFERTDNLRQVVDATLASSIVGTIYLSLDGPRGHGGEKARGIEPKYLEQLTALARDRPGFQFTRHDKNLGLRDHMRLAIDWVLSHEHAAAILEDDCVPTPEFFSFTSEMLTLYQSDKRILTTTGTNMPTFKPESGNNHFFSRYPRVWGWATWRDRWASVNDIRKIPEEIFEEKVRNATKTLRGPVKRFWTVRFRGARRPAGSVWSYDLVLEALSSDRMTVVPSKNLVLNIGEGIDGSHTKKFPQWIIKSNFYDSKEAFSATQDVAVTPEVEFDKLVENLQFSNKPTKKWTVKLLALADRIYLIALAKIHRHR
jgi:hypothetical protein